jgi:putative tryptophan/tyrosine transport system substrate-binding protein
VDRRAFLGTIAGSLVLAPLAAEAQQGGKAYRIGYLINGSPGPLPYSKIFLQGLRDLGYVEGRDFVMEYRFAEGHTDRYPQLVTDLVRAQVDVIVTASTGAALAAKQATQSIPIVFATATRVVQNGLVQSLARPGGNATGLQLQLDGSKGLQLLKDAVPTVTRVVHLHPVAEDRRTYAESLRLEAQTLHVELQSVAMSDPSGIERAFAEFGRGTNGLLVQTSPVLNMTLRQICGLALQRRLPAAGYGGDFAAAGCLLSYGERMAEMYRRAAWFVDKILKGTKPGDLPVEQATKFELVVNLTTAKALGLTIPPSLLQRANQVIE